MDTTVSAMTVVPLVPPDDSFEPSAVPFALPFVAMSTSQREI
ncbi:hypothetical protein [Streptomyces sp. ITFR-6]|nr:hypothetical protein [Streptomyces sp. ITFR-6]WNI27801.1 hypothetical protein RLT59_02720 [Streptomyces sp. ITFR-6]